MKYLFLFSIFLIYGFQCNRTLRYDGSERYRLKGTVTDENGLPLKVIPVMLYGALIYEYSDHYLDEIDGIEIMSTKTGKDGKFEFIFSGSDANGFTLFINQFDQDHYYSSHNRPDSGYQEKAVYFNVKAFNDFDLDVSENLVLKKAVSLTFKCPDISTSERYYIDLHSSEFVNLNIEQDIRIRQYLSYTCSQKAILFLPVNEWVKFDLHRNNATYADSILIGESPVVYTLK